MLATLALMFPAQAQDTTSQEVPQLRLTDLPFDIHNYVLHASFGGPEIIRSEFTGVTARDRVKLKIVNEGPARATDVQVDISIESQIGQVYFYILGGRTRVGSCDDAVNTVELSTLRCTIKGIGPGKTRTIHLGVAGSFPNYIEGDPAPIMEVRAEVAAKEQLLMRNGALSEYAEAHWPLATTGGRSFNDTPEGKIIVPTN